MPHNDHRYGILRSHHGNASTETNDESICLCLCTCTLTLLSLERTTCQLACTSRSVLFSALIGSRGWASARGPAPTRSLLSGMCSSTQTNLPHRLCRTLPQGSILLFGTRWLDYLLVVLTQLLAFIMRVFTWADQTRNKTKQNKKTIVSAVCF